MRTTQEGTAGAAFLSCQPCRLFAGSVVSTHLCHGNLLWNQLCHRLTYTAGLDNGPMCGSLPGWAAITINELIPAINWNTQVFLPMGRLLPPYRALYSTICPLVYPLRRPKAQHPSPRWYRGSEWYGSFGEGDRIAYITRLVQWYKNSGGCTHNVGATPLKLDWATAHGEEDFLQRGWVGELLRLISGSLCAVEIGLRDAL